MRYATLTPFQTRFRSFGSRLQVLNLCCGCQSPLAGLPGCSPSNAQFFLYRASVVLLVGTGFPGSSLRKPFTLPFKVPYAIGHWVVFRVEGIPVFRDQVLRNWPRT